MSWIMETICKHEELYIESVHICGDYFTTIQTAHKIKCSECGKTIVPIDQFNNVKKLFMKAGKHE